MTVTVADGPAIVIGYEYCLQIEAETDLFPAEARLAGQLRARVGAPAVAATLTTENGGILRLSDRVVELVVPAAATSSLVPGSVVLDLVRIDLAPPRHLAFMLEIPVIRPVTRGL